jgi:PKD repeat protein
MKKRMHFPTAIILGILLPTALLPACSKNNSNTENGMPTAVLAVDSTRGDIATVFHFDASLSYDKEDTQTSLMVAWNFGDGAQGYTTFSTNKTIGHSYTNTGLYRAKLIVKDTQGLTDTAAQIINIVTNLANMPPNKPVYTAPDNYSVSQPTSVNLTWLCDDPENDNLSFDIYVGNNPQMLNPLIRNITDDEYLLSSLAKGVTYYWQVAAHDPNGNYVFGDVWRFATAQ